MRHVVLRAIAGTSKPCTPSPMGSMLADMTVPAFTSEAPELDLQDLGAVVLRDAEGQPIDGGLFARTRQGEIVHVALVDEEADVNTDEVDPRNLAFIMVRTTGQFCVRKANSDDPGDDQVLNLLIVDRQDGYRDAGNPEHQALHDAIHDAFMRWRLSGERTSRSVDELGGSDEQVEAQGDAQNAPQTPPGQVTLQ